MEESKKSHTKTEKMKRTKRKVQSLQSGWRVNETGIGTEVTLKSYESDDPK